MSIDRKIIAASGAMQAAGAMLPFMSVTLLGTTVSASLTDGIEGWLLVILGLCGMIFGLLDVKLSSCITGAVCLFSTLYKDITARAAAGAADSIMIHSVGYYLLVIGSVVMIGTGVYSMVKNRKIG